MPHSVLKHHLYCFATLPCNYLEALRSRGVVFRGDSHAL
jgi:hypothetical protein